MIYLSSSSNIVGSITMRQDFHHLHDGLFLDRSGYNHHLLSQAGRGFYK